MKIYRLGKNIGFMGLFAAGAHTVLMQAAQPPSYEESAKHRAIIQPTESPPSYQGGTHLAGVGSYTQALKDRLEKSQFRIEMIKELLLQRKELADLQTPTKGLDTNLLVVIRGIIKELLPNTHESEIKKGSDAIKGLLIEYRDSRFDKLSPVMKLVFYQIVDALVQLNLQQAIAIKRAIAQKVRAAEQLVVEEVD